MVMLYVGLYLTVSLLYREPKCFYADTLGCLYVATGFISYIVMDCLLWCSRILRTTVTLLTVFSCGLGIFMSIFVWEYDPVVVDMYSKSITKMEVWMYCFMNIGLGILGGLYTIAADWKEGKFLFTSGGFVLREEVLTMDNVFDDVSGHGNTDLKRKATSHTVVTAEAARKKASNAC